MNNLKLFGAKLCWAAYEGGIIVDDHSFFVQETPDQTLVAFAGTANLENILEDAYVFTARTPGGYLGHAGVVRAYKELFPVVQTYLNKTKPPQFFGHSLGGGIARMFAERFKAPLITYGAPCTYPRVGSFPELEELRIVCDDDPVPKVPALFFEQKCPAEVLCDNDHRILEFKDHSINVYIQRLI